MAVFDLFPFTFYHDQLRDTVSNYDVQRKGENIWVP